MITSDRAPAPTATARELAVFARSLAAEGQIGDTVLARQPRPQLPGPLRSALVQLIRPPGDTAGHRVVPGLFAGSGDPGPTAAHWKDVDRQRTAAIDIAIVMVAGLVGEVFGWENQQDGRLVHNILPSRGCEQLQVGASSTAPLSWHTEDAFHPERADFLLLACLRNPDGIGSLLSTVRRIEVPPEDIAALMRPQLVIFPDDSYQDPGAGSRGSGGMATLWHGPDRLCIRYDPSYTRMLTADRKFLEAYTRIGRELDEAAETVPLHEGDLLIIDNDATVHGRAPFRARYDGTDRWLKRVLVRAPRTRPAGERAEHGFRQLPVYPAAAGNGGG